MVISNFIEFNQNKLNELIFNKRVVVIGSAQYLKNKNIGEIIDSYDTVIRVNMGTNQIKYPVNYGKRIDILYHNIQDIYQDNINTSFHLYQVIVGIYPPLTKSEGKNTSFPNGYINHYHVLANKYPRILDKLTYLNSNEYVNFENNVMCRPYSGLVVLDDVIKRKPSELYITGFTCGKPFTNDKNDIDRLRLINEHKSTYFRSHDTYLIWKYTKTLIYENIYFIKLDNELKEVLEFNLEDYKNKNNMKHLTDKNIFYHYLLN